MNAIALLKTTLLSSVFLLIPFLGQSQSNPFDAKKHNAVVLNKSTLQAKRIRGGFLKKTPQARHQSSGLESVRASVKNQTNPATLVTSPESGLPIFISTPNHVSSKRTEAKSDARTLCMDYLSSLSAITKIQNPTEAFEIKTIAKDVLGKTHVKLNQTYKGIRVHASEVVVHFNSSMDAELFNGNYHVLSQDIDVTPGISEEKALANVIADLKALTTYRALTSTQKQLVEHGTPVVNLVIYEDQSLIKSYLLAYHVLICPNVLENWEYFIHAKNGAVIKRRKKTCHADGPRTANATDLNNVGRTINTYEEGSDYLLLDASKPMYNSSTEEGAIITLDANYTFGEDFETQQITSSTNTWSDKTAVSAHHNASVAYDYYLTNYGRNSIDGNGGTIYSVINVVDDVGGAFDNAFWNGQMMFYGNGDTYFIKPLAAAMDVAGHEMTHGVIQYTANLQYEGEAGAINESMADIFGCMMDSTDWLMGEDISSSAVFPTGAIRSFSDPHNGGSDFEDIYYQPRHMSEKYMGEDDDGGVHINSGIPNWAFYKYATALNSRHKASLVFYRALTVYLVSRSQFIDLRLAVIQAAKDLYGNASNEAVQAGLAFDEVGIMDGPETVFPPTLPVNPGTEYLLYYDASASNINGLYRSSPVGANPTALLAKVINKKPSVTDNGETCVFVGTDKKIYRINVNPAEAITPTFINNQPLWSNVAISKDGKRIAAVTDDEEPSIYVYDFATSEWAQFELYNPDGTPSDEPVYADALEWSYDGEHLAYDCLNRISDTGGDDVEYWDIGMIKIWDKESNDFGDGEIVRVFLDREEGEHTGNPAFSKNSPHIMAFDYSSDISHVFAVIGYDLEYNDGGVIAYNNTIGYPAFNKEDNRVAFVSLDGGGGSDIYSVTLFSDKISSNETRTKLVNDGTWPVYLAVGERSLTTDMQGELKDNSIVQVYPNPTTDKVSFVLPSLTIEQVEMGVFNQFGQLVYKEVYQLNDIITLSMGEWPNGMYYVNLTGDGFNSSHKIVKQK